MAKVSEIGDLGGVLAPTGAEAVRLPDSRLASRVSRRHVENKPPGTCPGTQKLSNARRRTERGHFHDPAQDQISENLEMDQTNQNPIFGILGVETENWEK